MTNSVLKVGMREFRAHLQQYILATALVLDCPIWTEDKDFFGSGMPTWTTDRIHVFLK